MRFYNLPQYLTVTAPPNSLVDNLASTGIIGSLAFFFLVIVTMRSMSRLPRIYGTLGLVVLLAHYVDGLFDTFWIGALSITPVPHRRDLPRDGRCRPGRRTGPRPAGRGGRRPSDDRPTRPRTSTGRPSGEPPPAAAW